MEDRLKCQISHLVKYRQNPNQILIILIKYSVGQRQSNATTFGPILGHPLSH